MLIGKYKYILDSKNRLCMPHKFRGDLGGRCVVSKDVADSCLNVYPLSQWEIFTARIEQLPTMKMKRARQLIYSNSDEVDIDSQGRILLSQQLCEDVGLSEEKEAMIVGISTHAQIWSVSGWEKFSGQLNASESKQSIINDLLEMGF